MSNAVITVRDIAGNVVATAVTSINNATLNLGDIASGNYIIMVVNGDKVYTSKIEVVR